MSSNLNIIGMNHAEQMKAEIDSAVRGELDGLYSKMEVLMGSEQAWLFARSIKSFDRSIRREAYRAKIAELTADPCDASGIETPAVTGADEAAPKPIDNSERIAALFRELDECNEFQRALDIEQELRGYGVEAVDPQENRELERYASRQHGQRYGAL